MGKEERQAASAPPPPTDTQAGPPSRSLTFLEYILTGYEPSGMQIPSSRHSCKQHRQTTGQLPHQNRLEALGWGHGRDGARPALQHS